MIDSRAVFFVRCHHSINFIFYRHRYPPVPAEARGTCRVRGCRRHPILGNSTTAGPITFKFGAYLAGMGTNPFLWLRCRSRSHDYEFKPNTKPRPVVKNSSKPTPKPKPAAKNDPKPKPKEEELRDTRGPTDPESAVEGMPDSGYAWRCFL